MISPCGHGANDHAAIACFLRDTRREVRTGRKGSFGGGVFDELHGGKHPDATDFSDEGMITECISQTALQVGTPLLRLLSDVLAFNDIQVGIGGGDRNRVPRVRIAVRKRSDGVGGTFDDFVDGRPDEHTRQGRIGRRHPFGDRHQVWRDAVQVATERRTESSESAHDFIGDHQHIVTLQDFLYQLPIALRWRNQPACSQHRLGNKGADRVGPLAHDQGIQFHGSAF